MILAAGGCAEEVDEKPTVVPAQTQALAMVPGWVAGSGWPAETLVALNSVQLRQDSQILGNVAVIRAGSGPLLSWSYEAVVGRSVELRGDLRADSVSVQDGAHVFGSVASNNLINLGTIDGPKVRPLALPLPITVPTVPNFSAGTTDITVASSTTQTRGAGNYRNVALRTGSSSAQTVLTLSGGVYAFAELELSEYARVECSAACELRIKGRLKLADHTYIGPAATSGLQVGAVQVIVEGTNGGSTLISLPLAAEIGDHSELKAFVFVPNGTLYLQSNSSAIGKLIAKDLDVGSDADVQDGTAVVVLPGQWRSGSRWPSEVITALNSVDLNQGVKVTGDVAVISAATGAVLVSGYEASLGLSSLVTGNLRADSVIGRSWSRVTGALAYNSLTNTGVTAGSMVTPLALPLEITTPAFPAFSAGTTVVDVPSLSERTLAAGSYGLIKLRPGFSWDNTVLTLSGGVYNVADIDQGDYSRIQCTAPCELRVKNRIAQGSHSYLGPSSGSGLDISQVRVFVEGRNGGDGQPSATPSAAVLGASSSVSAFVFVPNGTLQVRSGVQLRGRVAARDVLVSDSARVEAAGSVITPAQITQQPSSISVVDGQKATFTVVAVGTDISFQWQRNGGDIPGATAGSYTLNPAGIADNGASFRVVVTNAAGSVTSTAATLTVTPAPPVITTQPASLTVLEGEAASFSCSASGTAPSYRWTKNDGNIGGATSASYSIASATVDHAGDYRCIASNAAGSATSDPAKLTVTLRAPVITVEPSDLTRTEGQTATFSVTATGTERSYQWRHAGQALPGATSATLTIAALSLAHEGQYDVVVSNSGGSVTSRSAKLTVLLVAPQVTQHPVSQTVTEGAPVTFTCGASGNLLGYQWLFGAAPILGATGQSLSIHAVAQSDAGQYSCVVSNSGGSDTIIAASLSVRVLAPEITTQPSALTVTEKQSASFSCAASGTGVSYRWQKNGANLGSGATAQTYTIASVTPEDAGDYRCIATNGGGSATSQAAALRVLLLPPVIESGPSSLTVTENEPATFSCTASGSSITYRWLKGSVAISGATSAVFTIAHAKEADEAEYRCEVTNSSSSATSEPARLTVQAVPPQITNQPDARTVDEHDSVSFTCAASGSGVTYHWQKDGADLADTSSATYSIADVKHTDAGGYACVATNESSSATSTEAVLTVRLIAPQITTQPQNMALTEREPASFHCEASGTLVSYRWQKNENDIPNSDASTFTIPAVGLDDAGSYRCIATNTRGSAISQAATLSVDLLPPRISAGPLSVRVYERQTATFQCLGEGAQLSYQWQKGKVDLPGATAAELAIVGVAYTDAGEYRCKVSNSGGDVFSLPASLTVDLLPPSFPAQPASVTLTEGEPFSLSCPAEGTLVTFQWLKDETPIDGAVFATYSVESALVEHSGVYTCIASNSGGDTPSQPASVVVKSKLPGITTQPADVHVNENQPITFSVVAQGQSLTYQWLRAGAPVPGATQSSYTKAQASPADDGAVFRVVVSNSGGSVTSNSATVHVADTSGPALEVSGETEVTVSGDTFTVKGSASDGGSGLREVTLISDRVPGQTFGVVMDSAGAFSGDIPLSLGTNVITIVARDEQNNETRHTITIKVTAPELPQITITAPADDSTVQTERITVSGRVRSSQPGSDIKLLLGAATLYPSGSGPDYAFSFEQVRLVPGPNLITVVAQTPRGNTQADVKVTHGVIQPPPSTPIPPVIELQPNVADMYLSTDTIPVTGTVRAQRCVQSIRVNGTAVSFLGTGPSVTFSTTRSFSAAGSNDVLVTVSTTDCDAQVGTVSFTAHRDDGAPVIQLDGVQLAPVVNTVSRTPYRLSGSVTDGALAGVSIASQSIAAQPTGVPGQWSFAVDLELQRQFVLPIVIEAWDAAGGRSSREVILQLDSNLVLEVLAPNDRAQYVVTGQPVPIEITARAIGMASGDVVSARFDEGSEFELLRAGPVANGVLNVAPVAGEHVLSVSVKSDQGSVLAQRSLRVTFTDESQLPVRVLSQEPAPDSTDIEANTPILVHFNRPIDPSLLTMSVVETVHGKLFEEQAPGADLTKLSAVSLIDVDRERDPVPGSGQNLPGNRTIAFYPSRDFGYGGTVFVDLKYGDNDLAHSKFTVRPLPTLVHGFVATQQLIPLQGIEVFLPELGRTARSNDDGNWNFGFGEPAERRIPPGRYRAVFNAQRKNDRFGSIERFIEITPGLAFGGTVLVPELNKAEPFRRIASLQPTAASLASGGLQLDLSRASLVFPDGLAEGDVHVQFLVGSEVGHVSIDGARPDWVFGVQPGGVKVQGSVGIRMQVPKLDQSFEYVDKLPEYMLLVGLDPKSLQIAPVGAVHLDRAARRLDSVGVVRLERLDYVGVAITGAEPDLLRRYANGELDLTELIATIGAAP